MTTNILYRNSITPTVPVSTIFKGTPLTYDELDGNFKSIVSSVDGHIGSNGAVHGNATLSTAGFMSAADKFQLNGLAADVVAASDNAVAMAIALG